MTEKRKTFVAGHNGLVGTAVCKALASGSNPPEILTAPHAMLNLEDSAATLDFFKKNQPTEVVMCAAKVGGIIANSRFPHDFLYSNIKIQTSIFDAAHACNVERLIFLGSSCIYPRDCPQPILEKYLLTGPLEPTNRAYAIAKIAGVEAVWAYNKQFGRKWVSLMPTNLFGFGDNYHPEHSHVLPALLRRMHEAKLAKTPQMVVWGTGNPKREFMFADELGDAVKFIFDSPTLEPSRLFNNDTPPNINVGTGSDISIKDLAYIIKDIVGYEGDIVFDTTKPDGTPRKLLDVSKLASLGWASSVPISDAIKATYADFASNTNSVAQR
jgi:GDP-L-fucose synthase